MNSVQKNFKKQMKQGLKKLKNNDKESYQEYVKWNHLDDVESRQKKENYDKVAKVLSVPFKILLKIIMIIIVIIIVYFAAKMMYSSPKSLADDNLTQPVNNQSQIKTISQRQIISYMNFINPIIKSINNDIDLGNNDANSLNKKLLTKNEYINNCIVYKNRITNNVNKIAACSCPKELEPYKNALIDKYSDLTKAMDIEAKYMNSGDISLRNECMQYINSFNSKNKNSENIINSILKESGLK